MQLVRSTTSFKAHRLLSRLGDPEYSGIADSTREVCGQALVTYVMGFRPFARAYDLGARCGPDFIAVEPWQQ